MNLGGANESRIRGPEKEFTIVIMTLRVSRGRPSQFIERKKGLGFT